MAERDQRANSLALLRHEVGTERDAQLRHFDALDSKAGVALGFAAAIVAIAPQGNAIIEAGRGLAILAALFALFAFWPRAYPTFDPLTLRERYLTSQPEFTELVLLDTEIEMVRRAAHTLQQKALWLRVAMMVLLGSAALVGSGIAVH